jgi:hypothetical protein
MQAKKLREEGSFEDALAEVGLGLIVDPNNAELQQLEAELWETQSGPGESAAGTENEDTERLINIHLAAAEQFQEKGEFVRALDEIAKAYQIDPLNQEIKKRETQIRQEEARRVRPDETPLKLVYPKKGAAGGMN